VPILRFSKAFAQVENLTTKYQELNVELEERVKNRTQELREKNTLIMDSINYAKMIQRALLPNRKKIKDFLPDSFFIWMPRDIVGGDIFSANALDEYIIVAVIDCTGHGVPGAFMTMIASTGLKRIIQDEHHRDPADILKRLNFIVKTSLQQDTDFAMSDDGLDAAVCVINRQKKTMIFSGAKSALIAIDKKSSTMIKGDKQSLGYKQSRLDYNYTNHHINIDKDMAFYLFTDGFTDQLGGERNIMFGNKRLQNFLTSISPKPFEEQKEILLKTFETYRGDNERKDDVTVLGFGLRDLL
jgi:serine phosphatase RsbU (regulator of sigma subunit)